MIIDSGRGWRGWFVSILVLLQLTNFSSGQDNTAPNWHPHASTPRFRPGGKPHVYPGQKSRLGSDDSSSSTQAHTPMSSSSSSSFSSSPSQAGEFAKEEEESNFEEAFATAGGGEQSGDESTTSSLLLRKPPAALSGVGRTDPSSSSSTNDAHSDVPANQQVTLRQASEEVLQNQKAGEGTVQGPSAARQVELDKKQKGVAGLAAAMVKDLMWTKRKEDQLGSDCKHASDCEAPQVCSQGRCLCPVLRAEEDCHNHPKHAAASSSSSSSSKQVAGKTATSTTDGKEKGKASKWFPFASFRDPKFGANWMNRTWESLQIMDRKTGQLSPVPRDLDFSRCAVVGSSSILLRAKRGPEIDNHTVVIRFNEAPAVKKLGAYVGYKTSLRLQNGQRCGYSDQEPEPEYCMGFTQAGINCPNWRKSRCKQVQNPPWLENYMTYYWSILPPPTPMLKKDRAYNGRVTRASGGFSGILVAMSLCAEVDIYGFDARGGGNHYYAKTAGFKKKSSSKPKPWYQKHYFSIEGQALGMIRQGLVPNVRLIQ